MTERVALVVPCYNEAERLRPDAFRAVLEDPDVDLVLVDDGSRDATAQVLAAIAEQEPHRIRVMRLPRNAGKAEAVRQGLIAACSAGTYAAVGYVDADFATPAVEVRRLIDIMRGDELDALLGARVGLLGYQIERNIARHYLGRVFGSLASLALRLPVYDTQCGAKLFRTSATLQAAIAEPFLSRWAFDVELLGRLLVGSREVPGIDPTRIKEEPLRAWRDVKGSKVRGDHMARMLVDLGRIAGDLSRRKRAARRH